MVGAHPDDEDTELLTVLARGMGAEAAYLSLTRGEGGQNLIGAELGDGLGVLRTEELLAARRLDGARQFFTRAFDFGYSKSLEDTWRYWPRDSVLKDVIRVVRRFRPQVLIPVFSGTPRDGHGQHQASGWAVREAFRLAGDPAVFPELMAQEGLTPWTPLKLYQTARFGGDATLTLDGGALDPAVGQSYRQIAMRGRSLHRSQDMGTLQPMGPSDVRIILQEDRTGSGEAGALFTGVDTTLAGLLPDGDPATRTALVAIGAELRALRPWDLSRLPELRHEAERLLGRPGAADPAGRPIAEQLGRIDHALFLGSRVICDALASTDRLVPGAEVRVTLSCWNAGTDPHEVTGVLRLLGREAGGYGPHRLGPGALRTDTVVVRVPADAPATDPYFLRHPPLPGMALYRWDDDAPRGEPFEQAPAVVEFRLANGGVDTRDAVYRYADQAIGEIRRPLVIVPAVILTLSPASGYWPMGAEGTLAYEVGLRATNGVAHELEVRLEVPPGWTAPASQAVSLSAQRPEQRILFRVRPGAAVGRQTVRAVASDREGRRFALQIVRVEYPHTRIRQLAETAAGEVTVAPLERPAAGTIAYVRGAADAIPEALESLGLRLDLLSASALLRGDLSGYRAIVIGPRAYETDPAMAEVSARLIEFAHGGGTVVVQYQQQTFFRGDNVPFPLSLSETPTEPLRGRGGAPRVAEETAAVTMLDPGHAVLRGPNPIGAADWQGWVQERGLYFARSWSEEWSPLLEMADAGEPPQRGGLLVARVGGGHYVYTGLSFFRQLPAGVPGAVRLFLNLIALGANGTSP